MKRIAQGSLGKRLRLREQTKIKNPWAFVEL